MLITEYQPNLISLTTGETNRYHALQDTNANKSVKIISTASIASTQVNGLLRFLLPGISDTLLADATLIRDDTAVGLIWSGTLRNKSGYVTFIQKNNLTSGYIQLEQYFFEISPINTTYQFLIKRNNDQYKGCGNVPDTLTAPPSLPITEDPKCAYEKTYNTCPALISVLMVISPEAESWILANFGSFDAFAMEGQTTTNQAFYNSDIPNKEVRIKWIQRDYTADLSNPLTPNIDFDRDKLPSLSSTDRALFQSDVVVLITNRGYDQAGAASDIGPNTLKACMIVEAPFFISQFVFAHELGHVLGCLHNWPVDLGDSHELVCSHAKRSISFLGEIHYDDLSFVTQANTWITLVGSPVPVNVDLLVEDQIGSYLIHINDDHRILNYSNPDIFFQGEATGRPGSDQFPADNANFIRDNACTVADFFPTQELVFYISSETQPCIPSKQFTAVILPPASGLPGQGPYSFRWFSSLSGIFTSSSPMLGTTQTITLTQHPACPVYWLKCIIISSDGVSVSRIRKITRPAYCCSTPPDRDDTAVSSSQAEFKLYPNPVDNETIQIEASANYANVDVQYSITDLKGIVLSKNTAVFDAEGRLNIHSGSLSTGIYLLHLKLPSGEVRNFKFSNIKH